MRLLSLCIVFLFLGTAASLAEPFNVGIDLPSAYKTVEPGQDIWFTVNAVNLATQKRIDITLAYAVRSADGTIVVSNSKTVAIETQASFVADLRLPETIKPGPYNLDVVLSSPYGNGKGSTQFVVQQDDMRGVYYIIAGVFIAALLAFIVYENRSALAGMGIKLKVHSIVKTKLKKK